MTRQPLEPALFEALWRFLQGRQRQVVVLAVILTVLSIWAAVSFLHLNSDQDRLVSPDLPFQKQYLEHLENFGDQEYLYVVIKSPVTEPEAGSVGEDGRKRAILFADSLAAKLSEHPEMIRKMYYRITADDLGDGALLYASRDEAQQIADMVQALAPSLKSWLDDGSLAGFFDRISALFKKGGAITTVDDPVFFTRGLEFLGQVLSSIESGLKGEPYSRDLPELTGMGARYFFSASGGLLFMRILPAKDYGTLDVIEEPLMLVRDALHATRLEFPDVEAGLTGRPVLQADEMRTTDSDMTRASIIAVLVVGCLFMLVFRGWLRPLLIVLCLMAAISWTFGFATAAYGELNLLSIVFTLVLVGIGVDFGVHVAMRFVEERGAGLTAADAVLRAVARTGPGIFLGAVTSVCAFYAVVGSDFQGLAELGMIGGTGILLCLLAMLTLLPCMLLLTSGGRTGRFRAMARPLGSMEAIAGRPGILFAVIAAVTLAALPGLFKVRFNYNLLELQARGLESVRYERLMIEDSEESTWYAIVTAKGVEDMREMADRLERLAGVGRVESLLNFIPEDQGYKSGLFREAAAALGPLHETQTANRALRPPEGRRLAASLESLMTAFEDLEEKLFSAGAGEELALLQESMEHIDNSLDALHNNPDYAERLSGIQGTLYESAAKAAARLSKMLTTDRVSPEDLPTSISSLYIGKDGALQIRITPRENIWEFEKLKEFVAQLRAVAPDVSGVPVGVLESARLMRRTFLTAAGITLILVSIILWLHSRSILSVGLTLLPLAIGICWLLELMGWMGVQFNLANFFSIPILIAIGVDGGVHIRARWLELGGKAGLFSTGTPMAVALSFLTTMIGFGGLLLAHHRGLASLGSVMVLGSFTSMAATLLVLPAALAATGFGGGHKE